MYNILNNLWDKLIFPFFNGFMSMAQVSDNLWNGLVSTLFSLFESLATAFTFIVDIIGGIIKFFGA